MKQKLALAALLLSAVGAVCAAQQNDSTVINGMTDRAGAPTLPSSSAPNDALSPAPAPSGSTSNTSTTDTSSAPDTRSVDTPNPSNTIPLNSSTAHTDTSSTVKASTGPGLVEGVVENTDPDRIAAIEQHARQLESKQFDSYEAPAAGKRHKHSHRHAANKSSGKPAAAPTATTPVQ